VNIPQLYIHCTGQDDNIGDVILRRRMLDAIRPWGRIHAYVGKASQGFRESLTSHPEDRIYSNYQEWLSGLKHDAFRGRASFFRNPGELTSINRREEISVMPRIGILRLRGGKSFILGLGIRHAFPFLRKAFVLPSVWGSNLCYWRDTVSPAYFRSGKTMPDWAFGLRPSATAGTTAVRDAIAVSLRDEHPYPKPDWIESIRRFAKEASLKLVVVTQVRRDQPIGERLSRELGAELFGWAGESHQEQEAKVRLVYGRCQLVVSDRLHALILGLVEGASPLCLIGQAEEKIGRHFAAIGLQGVSLNASGLSYAQMRTALESAVARREEAVLALEKARQTLASVENEIALVFRSERRGRMRFARL
jgi:polysaccharide pyruvyl transferase WcaK-like protein